MTDKRPYKLLIGQVEISTNIVKNVDKIKEIVRSYLADLYIFPELALTGYQNTEHLKQEQIFTAIQEIQSSLRSGILLLGSPNPYSLKTNSYLLVTKETTQIIAEKYLLFPGLDDKFGYHMGFHRDFIKLSHQTHLGVVLCFELRSPEIIRSFWNNGIVGVVVASQWPEIRINHFEVLLKARAIENQIYTIGVNGVGKIDNLNLGGRSSIYSPSGEEILKLGHDEEIAITELSFEIPYFPYPLRTPLLEFPKLKTLSELLEVSLLRRKKGQKMVFTNGCFDILHAGHIDYLMKARKLGDFLVVGLNSDESIRRIKGPTRPVNNLSFRISALSGLASVDYIVVFEEDTPEELIKTLKPDVLVKGEDWKEEEIAGGAFVKSYGGKVVRIPFSFNISTTKIIEKIRECQQEKL